MSNSGQHAMACLLHNSKNSLFKNDGVANVALDTRQSRPNHRIQDKLTGANIY
jgi:hypothetical protein